MVGAVWLVLVGVTAMWLAIDRHPPEWDYANHLERAVLCWRGLVTGDVAAVLGRSSFYPPLVPCLAGLLFRVMPSDAAFGQIVVLAFLGLGMAATYVLARQWANGGGAVVAAVLVGTAPLVVQLTLRFQLDVPLMAMVVVALETLLRTQGFKRAGWSLAVGIIVGLGLLTKPPFVVYVAPAIILSVLAVRTRDAVWNTMAATLVTLIIAVPWYGPRILGIPMQVQSRSFKQAAESGLPDALSATSLAYYPLNFAAQFGVVGVAMFMVGLVVVLGRGYWYVLAGLAPLVAFFLIQNKQLRYTLPLLPLAAVAAGIGFSALPRSVRAFTGALVAVAAAVQVSSTLFAVPPALSVPLVGIRLTEPSPPSRAAWQQRPILSLIARDASGRDAMVSVPPNSAWFSIANFRYYAVRDDLPLRFMRAWDDEPLGVDYMILKTGDVGPPWTAERPRRIVARLAADRHLDAAFPVIGEFPLPDGSRATVRARRLPVVSGAADTLARALAGALRQRAADVARDVEGLEVAVEPGDAIQQGRARRVVVSATAATLGDTRRRGVALLRAHDLRLVLEDLVFNASSLMAEGRLDPLDLGRLRLERLSVTADDFHAFLAAGKDRGRTQVAFDRGFADVRMELPGPDISARVRFVPASDRPFALAADRVRVGGVPVPSLLVGWVMNVIDPSRGIAARLPFPVEVARIEIVPAGLQVGGS